MKLSLSFGVLNLDELRYKLKHDFTNNLIIILDTLCDKSTIEKFE